MIRDEVISNFYNRLFSDDLDYYTHCKHNEYVTTRLNIPQKKIIIVSNPKGTMYEKDFN